MSDHDPDPDPLTAYPSAFMSLVITATKQRALTLAEAERLMQEAQGRYVSGHKGGGDCPEHGPFFLDYCPRCGREPHE